MSIVIIGDEEYESLLIERSLKNEYTEVSVTYSLEDLAELADKQPIQLLLFCFSTIDIAEDVMSELTAKNIFTAFNKPAALILCRGADAEKATQLCNEEIFKDYLIVRPLQDVNVLYWFISRNLKNYQPDYKKEIRELMSGLLAKVNKLQASFLEIEEFPKKFSEEANSALDELNDSFYELINKEEQNYPDKLLSVDERQRHDNRIENMQERLLSSLTSLKDNYVKQGVSHFSVIKNDIQKADFVVVKSQGVKILLVDDNGEFRNMIQDVLETKGYTVLAAGDANTAILNILQYQPDLVLLDYDMPNITGLEMIEKLKIEQHSVKRLPTFIMMTGYSQQSLVKKSAEMGAVDFIVKPVRVETLLSKIEKHLAY